MKCMSRNKARLFYAVYSGRIELEDAYGNKTGEWCITHSNPCEVSANISAAKGETQSRQFGESEVYDKIIVGDNSFPAIDEYSILWIDVVPQLEPNGSLSRDETGKILTPHDYVVTNVARSLNHVSVAVSKVKVQ